MMTTPAAASAVASGPPNTPAGHCASAPFRDVPAGSTFCSEIAWLSTTGVTGGYTDHTFRPAVAVSRQTMAAFLHRYGFSGQSDPACAGPARLFPDVSKGGFCGSIEWLAGTGITGGYTDGTFRPTAPVTRGSMAAFLYRFAHPGTRPAACPKAPFTDVPKASVFCPEITWLASTGITGGRGDGTFGPGAPVTRGTMAAFLFRANRTGAITLDSADPLPTVTAIKATVGSADGGTAVTVTGTGLTGATALILDLPSATKPAQTTTVTVVSDTTITATTPARYAGTVPVRVVTPRGTSVPTTTRYTYRTDWTQSRNDAAHTGWNPREKVITPANAKRLAEEWSVVGGGYTAIVEGVLYVSGTDEVSGQGRLSAYTVSTGATRFSMSTDGCSGPLAVTASLVIVGCSAPRAYQSGGSHKVVWDIADTDPGQSVSTIQVVGSTLLAWNNDHVAAFRVSDGQRLWQQLMPSGASSLLDVAASGSTVAVAYDNRLRGLSLATGAQKWSRTDYQGYGFTQLVIAGGWIYTNSGAGVRRFALATGKPGWSVRAGRDIYRIEAADATTVYAWEAVFDFSAPYPSVLHALRTSNGSQRWQADVPSRIGQVAIAGDIVWLTSTGIYNQEHASDLIALNRANGKRLRHLHYADNMYGTPGASFASGKVVIDQGGSAYEPAPRRLRVFGLSGRVPAITTSVLPMGKVGKAYSVNLAATPGGATWTVASGKLPAGITLSSTGQLRGTPEAAGTSRVVFRAKGGNGRTGTASLPLQVVANESATWTTTERDATRNAFTSGNGSLDVGTAPSIAYRWSTAAPGEAVHGDAIDVVVSGSRMYVTAWDGKLRAFDTTGNAANRHAVWTAVGDYVGPPSLAGNRLIVRSADNTMHGIRTSDGADLWSTAEPIDSAVGYRAPLVIGNAFVVPDTGSSVRAYSTADGTPLWAQPSTAQNIHWNVSSDGVRLYAMAECDLVALRLTDGAELWRTQVTKPENCAPIWTDSGPPIVLGGKVYAATASDRLVAEASSGATLLHFAASGYQMGRGVVAGGLWIFGVTGNAVGVANTVIAVDTVTGRLAWRSDRGVNSFLRISVVRDLVIVASNYDVIGLSRLTGALVWDGGPLDGVSGTPVIAGKRILINSRQGVRAYGPL